MRETHDRNSAEGERSGVQLFGSSEGSVTPHTSPPDNTDEWAGQAVPEQLWAGPSTGSLLSRIRLSQQVAMRGGMKVISGRSSK